MTSLDTVASQAVQAAERTLARLDLPDPRLAPPLRLDLPDVPARKHGSPARVRPVSPHAVSTAPGTPPSGPATPVLTSAPTVTEALALLDRGLTTTQELVAQAIDTARRTADLGAVVALDEDDVRAQAGVLDGERRAGRLRGPLHGIPVTVKDVIDVAGLPTRAGSRAYDDRPGCDAAAVARLRSAGALVLAKVATHEFALGVTTPQCRNPHDPTRISGGSSGGSAIAVATGVGLASLGTDTRASLRVPAALCGVVGFKPTFGRVPTAGIVPLSWTIDHVGPVARDMADAALLVEVLAGSALRPFPEPGERDLVVGVVAEVMADADIEVVRACEEAVAVLERQGCTITELSSPDIADLELSNDLGLLVSRSEAAAFHRSRGTDLSLCLPEVRDQLGAALGIGATDYLDAQRHRSLLSQRAVAAFTVCDVIAMPTSPVVAPRRDDYERYLLRLSRNTILWSLAGCPAVSMPCGADSQGMPVGFQLTARPGDEGALVAAGLLLEQGLGRR